MKPRALFETLATKKGITEPHKKLLSHLLNYYFQTIYYIEKN